MSGALAKQNQTDLVPANNFNLACLGEIDGQAWSEEMDGLTISFDRVKVPSGGGLAFKVPGDNPDKPEVAAELSGVIIDHYPVNTYWKNKYSGENNPPDCASMDGKIGTGEPGGNCKMCPMNQWGSDSEGNGKACKNMHRIYLLREGEVLPIQLTLPPTSLKNFSDFLAKRVVGKGKRSYGVVTKIALKEAKSGTGIDYSQATFAVVSSLDPEQVKQLSNYSTSLKPITRIQKIDYSEYNTESSSDFLDDGDPF